MSSAPQDSQKVTQGDNSAVDEPACSRLGMKWIVGIAGVSIAAAALIVTSVASTSAEAPVLANDAHVVQTAKKVEKKSATKAKATKKADTSSSNQSSGSEGQSSGEYYQPVRQSIPTATTSGSEQSEQEPKYGKNADSDAKVPSKAKKPSSKQNMTEGTPPAGVPIEGPINHAE